MSSDPAPYGEDKGPTAETFCTHRDRAILMDGNASAPQPTGESICCDCGKHLNKAETFLSGKLCEYRSELEKYVEKLCIQEASNRKLNARLRAHRAMDELLVSLKVLVELDPAIRQGIVTFSPGNGDKTYQAKVSPESHAAYQQVLQLYDDLREQYEKD